MKVKITYFQGGKTWDEIIRANDVSAARKIAEVRNPGIKIVASNPVV